jgi:hypothetical protein
MVLCAAVLILGACAGPSGAGPGAEPPSAGSPPAGREPRPTTTEVPLPDRTPTLMPTPAQPGPVGDEVPPDGTVEAAVLDLAAHLGVPREAVSVVAAEHVTWPDGALGCPQPGSMYTQAQVDGMRIELSAGGTTYRYHSGGGRAPFRCEHAHPRALDG